MQLAYEILHYIRDGKFHSGDKLAHKFKVSRSSIWNAIDFLRSRGILVVGLSGRGYRLKQPIELITKEEILSNLNQDFHKCFPEIHVLNAIASTNDYLISRLENLEKGTVCVALEQTHGKGRAGKEWYSPLCSNIYLSFSWKLNAAVHDLSGLSLIIGLIVIEAIISYFGYIPKNFGIKWPNDIWFENRKLCGVLIETFSRGTINQKKENDFVIGIGLNVSMPESYHRKNMDLDFQTQEMKSPLSSESGDFNLNLQSINFGITDLCTIFNQVPSKNKLVALLLQQAAYILHQFENKGFKAFSERWKRFDLLNGKPITITSAESSEDAIAAGINERGELCIAVGNTLRALRYGEVSVRPLQTIVAS